MNNDITLKFETLNALKQFEDLNDEMALCLAGLKVLIESVEAELDIFSKEGLLAGLGVRSIEGWQTIVNKRTETIWEIESALELAEKAA